MGAMRGSGQYGQIFTKGDYGNFRLIVTSRGRRIPETGIWGFSFGA